MNWRPYILNENLLGDVDVDEVEDSVDDSQGQEYDLEVKSRINSNKIGPRMYVINNMKRKMTAFLEYQKDVRRAIDSFDEIVVDCPDKLLTMNIKFSASFGVLRYFNAFLFAMCDVIEVNSGCDNAGRDADSNSRIVVTFSGSPNTREKPYFEYPSKHDVYTEKTNIVNFYKSFLPSVDDDDAYRSYITSAIRYGRIFCVDAENGLYKIRDQFRWRLVNNNGDILTNDSFEHIHAFKEGYGLVEYRKNGWTAYNFIDTNGNMISDENFEDVLNGFENGYACVMVYDANSEQNKWNFIDKDCNFLFKEPFDEVCIHNAGDVYTNGDVDYIIVKRNNEYNYVNKDYKIPSKMWFTHIDSFVNGFAVVYNKERKENYLGLDGKLLSNKWFDTAYSFKVPECALVVNDRRRNSVCVINRSGELLNDGEEYSGAVVDDVNEIVRVSKNEEENIMDYCGKYLLSKWYYLCGKIQDGFIRVTDKNHRVNFVNLETNKELTEDWFDANSNMTGEFHDGLMCVGKDELYNFIDKHGNYISDDWFIECRDFSEGFAYVKISARKRNYIDTKGNLITDVVFSEGEDFKEGFAKITSSDGRINYLKPDGSLLVDEWLYYGSSFINGFARVCDKSHIKKNYMKPDGELLSDEWFDYTSPFMGNVAEVMLNGKYTLIDRNGKFLFDSSVRINKNKFNSAEYCVVTKSESEVNIINKKTAKVTSDTWFKDCVMFDERTQMFVIMNDDDKFNFMNTDGTLLLDDFVDGYNIDYEGEKIEVKIGFCKNTVGFDGKMIEYV